MAKFYVGVESDESREKLVSWIDKIMENESNLCNPKIYGYHTLSDGNCVIDFHDSDSAKMMKMLIAEGFEVS